MNFRHTIASLAVIASLAAPALVRAAAPAKSGADDVVVDDKTERLIDGGLKFIASRQLPNGSWAENDKNHAAAITAYALMAFMTTGNLPGEGQYGDTVRRGLDFLLNCVRADGYIAAAEGASNMYGHGISTIALGEMYGMTNDETIRPRLERAVKLILSAQNKEGGWRYDPKPSSADISVTVLQVVALRVAKNNGIDVPQGTIDRAVAYVHSCSHKSGGFTYTAGNGEPGVARTAAAIYSLQVCGLYDDPMVAAGSKYIFNNLKTDSKYFTYGANYAAPAHYMMGGETWRNWYGLMRDRLGKEVKAQGDRFYWNAQGPGGDVYGTAVYISVLAMPYGYLPLYQR